ncbi:protein kinase family protein [Siminovitchia sediminis]|uniref:Protein kinase family protein n=1 Tax=Siminovitchia sediminis TaxID=1274353 RepID=A0ABW4KPL1_9BACI
MKYQHLAESVKFQYKEHKPIIVSHAPTLQLIGMGRSAAVFKIEHTEKVLKVFFPEFAHIAQEEASVYDLVHHLDYYPDMYESGPNYIVIDFIHGYTFFDCLTHGIPLSEKDIMEVDDALSLAREQGLNPSDIHLRNIILTPDHQIKVIDVARFRQSKKCHQWEDLKKGFYYFYAKPFFPKKIPAKLLNSIAYFYKKLYRKEPLETSWRVYARTGGIPDHGLHKDS